MESFTLDLVGWIEQNLDKKILLDDVAAKSGYSKWYLQRMFRSKTGMRLATYIRHRRLTESAILFKMTGISVTQALELFGFTNQQAFTRTFTHHFNQSPVRYRETEHWCLSGLLPSLLDTGLAVPEPKAVWMCPPEFSGITHRYMCARDSLTNALFHTEQREHGLRKAKHLFQGAGPTCVTQTYKPASSGVTTRFCLTFSRPRCGSVKTLYTSNSLSGKYLCFCFNGTPHELTLFQINLYRHIMPQRAEVRRAGQDFFLMNTDLNNDLLSSQLCGDYFVPVIPTDAVHGSM